MKYKHLGHSFNKTIRRECCKVTFSFRLQRGPKTLLNAHSPLFQVLDDATKRLTAFHGDVLDFNMDTLFPQECVKSWHDTPPNTHIIGNLPFNVATPLIIQYMESIANRTGAWRYGRTKLTLTFQKEVAERMVAEINSDQRCRLSIVCQYLCHVNLKMVIPGECPGTCFIMYTGLIHCDFYSCNNDNFQRKNQNIFLIFALKHRLSIHICNASKRGS